MLPTRTPSPSGAVFDRIGSGALKVESTGP